MMCAWKELLAVLPQWMRKEVVFCEAEQLKEIRLRIHSKPELVLGANSFWLEQNVTRDDLHFIVNAASRYSPWAASTTAYGYITIKGGHRIGICGESVMRHGELCGIREYHSLCVRVAKDFSGIAAGLEKENGSVLILGPPGCGKTTLLRDMIRKISDYEMVSVVDERGELFPDGFEKGIRTDVMTGCAKDQGVSMLLRTMGPSCIAVDEITDRKDAETLLQAANCGVRLLASAHSDSLENFRKRSVYSALLENQVFDVVVILKKDHSYTRERLRKWGSDGSVRY